MSRISWAELAQEKTASIHPSTKRIVQVYSHERWDIFLARLAVFRTLLLLVSVRGRFETAAIQCTSQLYQGV